MSTRTGGSFYAKTWDEFLDMMRDFVDDTMYWLSGLSDVERLIGLCIFILLLFLLVLANGSSRTREPGRTRSFAGAFTLVVVFSFVAGLLIDSKIDPGQFLPANFL
ncbi:MAG: hypothetical protein R3C00_01075 [Hyphomonas sp.]|nr:hypothetical protein [Hyphomonas sp.]MCB9972266.1 hypothetical protein [Hyphomonas sp.]